jgi:tellurite resistance protein TerC
MLMDLLPWAAFVGFILVVLAIDLGVFHKDGHEMHRKEALVWSGVWIALAALFNLGVFLVRGNEDGLLWTTGYVVEWSLSIDNVFVFLLIFSTFAVPPAYRHRVLFWGILGALVMRALLIAFAGILLGTLHFVIYIFGAFLIFTGIRFLRGGDHVPSLEDNRMVMLAKRFFPVTPDYVGQSFFTKVGGVWYITPLLLVLMLIESTDLVFAVDSIPAIYAVTDDPFIIFTSNVFAILGLRSLYFVLAGYLAGLKYLKPGLAGVLVFVGSKMLLVDLYKIPALLSLSVIIAILSLAFIFSFRHMRAEEAKQAAQENAQRERLTQRA